MWRQLLARVAIAAAMPACNQVFAVETTGLVDAAPDADLRPDRDHDGIADVEDPCIAGERDATDDSDLDGAANNLDDCPFNPVASGDSDTDGVGDRCDPFKSVAGDVITCTMRFLDPELNASLWKPRAGESELAIASGYLIGIARPLPGLTSIVAQERISPTTGTISLHIPIDPVSNERFGFRVWVSAGPVPSDADVGCDVAASSTGVIVTPFGAAVLASAAGPGYLGEGSVEVRAVIQPGKSGPNLACAITYGPQLAYGIAHFGGELGMQGVAVLAGTVVVSGILVLHRDTQPDFL